jgi:sulfoxide reductase catalytic subunit YedY
MARVDFPLWLRLTHVFNILWITLMMRSGIQILFSLPKLYWKDDAIPGREWLKFTRKQLPKDRIWVSLDEEEPAPRWLALPGERLLGLGRHWHFAVAMGWILTGAIYVVLLFTSSEWHRLIPTSWSIFPHAWHALVDYLSLKLPPAGSPYNGLQKLSYFVVVFVVAPLSILTGIAMSPAWIGRFPWYLRIFGGKQAARSIHFICLVIFILFTIVHTAMVIVHGLATEFARMALGSEQHSHTTALIVGLVVLAVIAAIHVLATVTSNRHPRAVVNTLGHLVHPVQRGLSRMKSSQHYREEDISTFHRLNGYPPETERYAQFAENDFRDWRLDVTGLVENPLELSLDDLRGLERRDQITKHNCIQGWTSIAKWSGVPLTALIELARPRPEARYAVFHGMDDKASSGAEAEMKEGYFYEVVDVRLLRHPQTILAYEMNDRPLPVPHGAPLRLRLEVQLGFKMVKWLRAIEFVQDYAHIGEGHGGWREDHAYYYQSVAI